MEGGKGEASLANNLKLCCPQNLQLYLARPLLVPLIRGEVRCALPDSHPANVPVSCQVNSGKAPPWMTVAQPYEVPSLR